jgi:hypothetical protein
MRAEDVIGGSFTGFVVILDRLLTCAQGAHYSDNVNYYAYLKSLYFYCGVRDFEEHLYSVRSVTRGLRRDFAKIRSTNGLQDFDSMRYCPSPTCIIMLCEFQLHTETVLESTNAEEIVHAFEIVAAYTLIFRKYAELCFRDIINDDSISIVHDVSQEDLLEHYSYRFMRGCPNALPMNDVYDFIH